MAPTDAARRHRELRATPQNLPRSRRTRCCAQLREADLLTPQPRPRRLFSSSPVTTWSFLVRSGLGGGRCVGARGCQSIGRPSPGGQPGADENVVGVDIAQDGPCAARRHIGSQIPACDQDGDDSERGFPREAESFAAACQPFSEPGSLRGQRAKGPAVCVCSGQWPPAELPVSRREEELRVGEEFKGRCPNGSQGHAADAGEPRSNRWPGHGRGDQRGDSELPREPPCIPVTFQLDLSGRTAQRSGLPEVSVESRLHAWPRGRRENLR